MEKLNVTSPDQLTNIGAGAFALCDKCLKEGRENYRNMVYYISAAGHWPEDINEAYQTEVRRQLKLHDIREEVFKFEVERAILEEQAFMREYYNKETLKYAMVEESFSEVFNDF